MNLPKQVGAWSRPDAPRIVTAEGIFDYMDGGGELYLAYRFDHLDVFEYKPSDASLDTILVELYSMKDSDDACGLLSTDWGGEAVALRASDVTSASGAKPLPRALYGGGLLRQWAGRLYVRILAARETPETREVVLSLGRGIAGSASEPPPPALLEQAMPPVLGDAQHAAAQRPDRTVFFRSHLVLNLAYYLASQDILGLGPDVDGVTTEFKASGSGSESHPVRAVAVRYPSPARSAAALAAFVAAYVPEHGGSKVGSPRDSSVAQVEHGWVGWTRRGQDLVIVLDAPDERWAAGATKQLVERLGRVSPNAR